MFGFVFFYRLFFYFFFSADLQPDSKGNNLSQTHRQIPGMSKTPESLKFAAVARSTLARQHTLTLARVLTTLLIIFVF